MQFQGDSFSKCLSKADNVGKRSDCTFFAIRSRSTLSAKAIIVAL